MDGSYVGFFRLSIESFVEEFLRDSFGVSGDVVTTTEGVENLYTFNSLPRPAVAFISGESHVRERASTSSGWYIRAKETVPSPSPSGFRWGFRLPRHWNWSVSDDGRQLYQYGPVT